MSKQLVELIQRQINKLDNEDFDLDAWKSSTVAVLTRVFGKEDPRKEQIESLKIDYSSWALRDSNASYNPIESCKRKGKEILKTAIEEIEIFGSNPSVQSVLSKQFNDDELKSLLSSSKKKDKILQKLKKKELESLLLNIINSIS